MKEELDEILTYDDSDGENDSFELGVPLSNNIITYSRDWTIGTIFDQIKKGNINLTPEFQRRNAWKDSKRSKLIESIFMGYPIPEIVLAIDSVQKGKFIVIDGKQRLLTLAGFMDPSIKYWDKSKLQNLLVRTDLNEKTWDEISQDPRLSAEFENTSLRCSVICQYANNDVLYDIFYRLNSGSVPLATQELRQVLCKGSYANYLIDLTNSDLSPLQHVMRLKKADDRLRDVEVILRLMSFLEYSNFYEGNLKRFLDESMARFNELYDKDSEKIIRLYNSVIETIEILKFFYDEYDNVGRVYRNGKYERFNRVMLEVQVFYFFHLRHTDNIKFKKQLFIDKFKELCENMEFSGTFSSSTKNLVNYRIRYSYFQDLINKTFDLQLDINPF